ncbi:unnamed protein product [Protopolystoma xenopodis]|uniref:B30.2/SPRY domain-containing protein n=1 Tax=Protopolystoma xenopodis TaxID=117903 RepID=A0A3S5A9T8_9PLAT|nr:unnamed protein product [Protopolystoma xenopodis]
MDLEMGTIQWSKNGILQGEAYRLPTSYLSDTTFYPALTLIDTTLDVNFGNWPFIHSPGSAQAVREVIAYSSLFQSPVHQVSLKEDVHRLPDVPFSGVLSI